MECPIQDWMIAWVAGNNWGVVPRHIQDQCRFESDVGELVVSAMEKIREDWRE